MAVLEMKLINFAWIGRQVDRRTHPEQHHLLTGRGASTRRPPGTRGAVSAPARPLLSTPQLFVPLGPAAWVAPQWPIMIRPGSCKSRNRSRSRNTLHQVLWNIALRPVCALWVWRELTSQGTLLPPDYWLSSLLLVFDDWLSQKMSSFIQKVICGPQGLPQVFSLGIWITRCNCQIHI